MSPGLPDYYAILHVDPAAPAEVIRASYRTLMQQMRAHPDLGGDHEAAARLNAAYSVLKDPGRRAEYDADRARGSAAASGSERTARPERGQAEQQQSAASRARRHSHSGTWKQYAGGVDRTDVCPFCGTAASLSGAGTDLAESCRSCGAPLTILRPDSGEGAPTDRSVYRIAKTATARIYIHPEDRSGIEARLHDVSLSGMRFSCEYRLTQDDVVRVNCEICDAVARIAHVSSGESGEQYGAQFLTARFKRQRGSLLSVPA